jgi:hypothetical protein
MQHNNLISLQLVLGLLPLRSLSDDPAASRGGGITTMLQQARLAKLKAAKCGWQ